MDINISKGNWHKYEHFYQQWKMYEQNKLYIALKSDMVTFTDNTQDIKHNESSENAYEHCHIT
jgi:hypothetical protein